MSAVRVPCGDALREKCPCAAGLTELCVQTSISHTRKRPWTEKKQQVLLASGQAPVRTESQGQFTARNLITGLSSLSNPRSSTCRRQILIQSQFNAPHAQSVPPRLLAAQSPAFLWTPARWPLLLEVHGVGGPTALVGGGEAPRPFSLRGLHQGSQAPRSSSLPDKLKCAWAGVGAGALGITKTTDI